MPSRPSAERRALARVLSLLLTLAAALPLAQAHDGHVHDAPAHGPAVTASAADAPRSVYQSARLEAVAFADENALRVYVDDYAHNTPLAALSLQLRSGSRLLRAQEPEPGVYQWPLDLIDARDGHAALDLTIAGSDWQERWQTELALPIVPPSAGVPALRWVYGLGAALAFALLAVVLRRRLRRAR